MFKYLKGTVVDVTVDKIILEVNSIGYRINSTANSISKIARGEYTTIYTHLVVREDELSIYGFTTMEELSMFRLLLSVTKIGPKVASAILSTHAPNKLGAYILGEDIRLLCKAPGVGKKTAERMILELRDKVDKIGVKYDQTLYSEEKVDNEAIEALLALGYNRLEAEKAIQSVEHKSTATEDILKNALKSLAE